MTIDSHIHYSLMTSYKDILKALEKENCDKGVLMSYNTKNLSSQNIDCLYAKYMAKGKLYAYGALNSECYINQENFSDKMVEHVKHLMACGFDGIKMLEGKPSQRKTFSIPNFDSPLYDSYFAYVENNMIPITWHVNDPEEFWDPSKTPEWAKKSGWAYGFGGWVNNEDQYKQVENVLEKYPNLCICFAHFYFMSAHLDRLSKILDKYPNVCIDITPGIELYTNMSKNIKEARDFFIKYQDRILYGTDISLDSAFSKPGNEEDIIKRGKLCHEFITNDKLIVKGSENDLLTKEDLELNGLNLDKDIQDKIFYTNFLRRNPEMKEVNIKETLKEIEREKDRVYALTLKYGIDIDYHNLSFCKNFFENELNK